MVLWFVSACAAFSPSPEEKTKLIGIPQSESTSAPGIRDCPTAWIDL